MKPLIEKILLLDENKKVVEELNSNFYMEFHEIEFKKKIIENVFTKKNKIINNFCLEFITKLKHISYTNIIINNKIKFFIVLISCFDNYETQKKILNIFSIFFNNNNNHNDKKLLKFYANFFLNNFTIENKIINYKIKKLSNNNNNTDINIENNEIKNNKNNEYLLTVYKHKIINENLIIPLPEIELTILFDYFHIDDIIKIYSYLINEYSLIIVYDNFININYIILSFIYLLYPMKKKKYFQIYYNENCNLYMPNIICGINEKDFNNNFKYNNNFLDNNIVVYNLKFKKFLYDIKCEELDDDVKIFLRKKLSQLYGEKFMFKTSYFNINNSEISNLFNENDDEIKNIIHNNNINIYLNLKLLSIFYRVFLYIIKDINDHIIFSDEFFSIENSFKYKPKKNLNFFDSKIFSNFLISYLKNYKTKNKYIFIYNILNEKQNFLKEKIQNLFDEKIKFSIKEYLNNFNIIETKNILKDFLITNSLNENEKYFYNNYNYNKNIENFIIKNNNNNNNKNNNKITHVIKKNLNRNFSYQNNLIYNKNKYHKKYYESTPKKDETNIIENNENLDKTELYSNYDYDNNKNNINKQIVNKSKKYFKGNLRQLKGDVDSDYMSDNENI